VDTVQCTVDIVQCPLYIGSRGLTLLSDQIDLIMCHVDTDGS